MSRAEELRKSMGDVIQAYKRYTNMGQGDDPAKWDMNDLKLLSGSGIMLKDDHLGLLPL